MSLSRRHLAFAGAAQLLPVLPAAAATRRLRGYPGGPIYRFRWRVLQLALQHADGAWQGVTVEPVGGEAYTQPRAARMVEAGDIDVACFGVSAQRLQRLRPIRFDIMRGMVGLRYMIIRREDEPRLARLSDADYLHTLRYGLQEQWADVPVMQANGLKLELAVRAERLVGMLSAGRCDALPRGANEVLLEMRAHRGNTPALAVESSRVLYFPFPIYFWVREGNEELAQAIHQGLRRIEKSGELRQLFMTSHAKELAFIRAGRQRVIQLSADALPQPLERPDTSWWWPFD